jgi:molybdopterin molybdotransferase
MLSDVSKVKPPGDVLAALLEAVTPVERAETVPLHAARGRVLDRTIVAAETLPRFARAVMDGFAVRSADTAGARPLEPVRLRLTGEVLMGTVPEQTIGSGEALRIHTGAMLPPGADAVVMLEDTSVDGAEVTVLAASPPGDNVLQPGEDIQTGATALTAGTRLGVAELGGLASLGYSDVGVRARPRIAILSTGDEVVPVGAEPRAAQVRDVNAVTIAATVEAAGGVALPGGIVPDDLDALTARARTALSNADALVISAGSSVSHRDLTARVIAQLGTPGIFAHGIAIRPGKPTIVAMCDEKPVIGLPGNPASAAVVAWRIVAPLVRALGGERTLGEFHDGTLDARLTSELPSRAGREDYVPCALDRTVSPPLATPLLGQSNLIFTLLRSDGLAIVPFACDGLVTGEAVRVVLR